MHFTFHEKITLPYIGDFYPHNQRSRDAALKTIKFIDANGHSSFERNNDLGHVTSSAFIVSPDRKKTLLMHHKKLDRWLQPGGHCDGETDTLASAKREAHEETGLTKLIRIGSFPFDIDIHEIPARKDEPAHLHHDIRYLFEADPSEIVPGNHESYQTSWIDMNQLYTMTDNPAVLTVQRASLW